MGIIQKISNIALKPAVLIGNAYTKLLELGTGEKYGRTTSEELSKTTAGKVLGTATAGVASAAATGYAATTPAITAAVKSVTNAVKTSAVNYAKANPIKTTVGVLLTAGAVAAEPIATAKAAANLPLNIANVGGNIATLIAEPSFQNAKELVTENPVLVGGAAAAAVGSGILAIAPVISSLKNTAAIKEQTQAIISSNVPAVNITQPTAAGDTAGNLGTPATMQSSVIPAKTTTSDITATTGSGTRKKRRSKALPQQIKQSVRVNVVANSSANRTTKKYLNTIQLLN